MRFVISRLEESGYNTANFPLLNGVPTIESGRHNQVRQSLREFRKFTKKNFTPNLSKCWAMIHRKCFYIPPFFFIHHREVSYYKK